MVTFSTASSATNPGIVSSSQQIIDYGVFATFVTSSTQKFQSNIEVTGSFKVNGQFTASLQQGYAWVGGPLGTAIMVSTGSWTGSSAGGSGTGFPYTGSAGLSGSLIITGSVSVSGSITASSFTTNTAGIPEISSPSTLKLTAVNTVQITTSSLRLATFTDAQTSSLVASNGDMIYNSTSNKFMGYAAGAWVALN